MIDVMFLNNGQPVCSNVVVEVKIAVNGDVVHLIDKAQNFRWNLPSTTVCKILSYRVLGIR